MGDTNMGDTKMGYLKLGELDKPIKFFDTDWTNTMDELSGRIKKNVEKYMTDGFCTPLGTDDGLIETVSTDKIKITSCPNGFYHNGNYADLKEDKEFSIDGKSDGDYYAYLKAVEDVKTTEIQEDPFTKKHEYSSFAAEINLVEGTNDHKHKSEYGVLCGKIAISDGTYKEIEINRQKSTLKKGVYEIADKTVIASKILNNSITTDKIANGAITTPKILDNAITTNKIANDAITRAKVANDAITTNKIANDAITTYKVASDAITTDKIDNNAITTSKINNSAITESKIADNTITFDKLHKDTSAFRPGDIIMTFDVSHPDPTFVPCHGQPVSKSTYRKTYDRIGTKFGSNSTQFRLPDTRGYGIRFTNTESTGPDSRRELGSRQDDALQGHKHHDPGHRHEVINHSKGDYELTGWRWQTGGGYTATRRSRTAFRVFNLNTRSGKANLGNAVTYSSTYGTVRTASETRMKNIAFNCFIKLG